MTTVRELFGGGGHVLAGAGFRCGIECEMEHVLNPAPTTMFNPVPDGSLRNGIEFVSLPATRRDVVDGFKNLHATLKFKAGAEPFSVRTSTHVHINCLDMSLQDARTMVLLYALFEECFFLIVKPERRDNIHCVPLTETAMPSIYKKDLPFMIKSWHKYTGLNLKRLVDLGTMEFRHLHGTKDAEELEVWLQVLENLWTLAQRVSINKETLNKPNIQNWFEAIFAPSDRAMSMRHSLFDIIKNNVIDVKFSL